VNLSETADLLTAMSAFDRRTIGDGDVIAWQAVLADAFFEDCLEAVKRYYTEHTDWMMPAHVRRLVRDIVSEREKAARSTGWAPGQHGVPKGQAMPEVTGRVDEGVLTRPVRELLESMGIKLPEGSREALMPRTVAWEQEHRAYLRVRDGEPNPHYRPQARDERATCSWPEDCPTVEECRRGCVVPASRPAKEWCNSACRPESPCDSPRHWWQAT
jgi:hypothetical protein